MDAHVAFTSVGVNRAAGALDWDLGRGAEHGGDAEEGGQQRGLIAYGGASAVCLFDPESCEVVGTLTGHTSDVRCVRWLPPGPWASPPPPDAATDATAPPPLSSCLASGAGDGSVRLWLWRHGGSASSSPAGQCLAVLLPDGRALVDRDAQGALEDRDARARAASGAAATSSAAAAAAPSQRAPPASVGAASCVAAQALDAEGGRVLLAVSSAAPHVALWECDVGALVRRAALAGAAAATGAAEGAEDRAVSSSSPPPPVRLVQRLRIDGCLQHALAITPLPGTAENDDDDNNDNNSNPPLTPALLLAAGGTDGAVRLFVRPPAAAAAAASSSGGGTKFEPAATLTGHDNWVRGLAFAHTYADDEDEDDDDQQQPPKRRRPARRRALLLASASQDSRVRVWRLEAPEPSSSSSSAPAPSPSLSPAPDADADAMLDAALLRYAPRAAVRVPAPPSSSSSSPPSKSFEWTASLEALLSGHEDWVHAVQWRPPTQGGAGAKRRQAPPAPPPLHLAPPAQPRARLALLSASHDRTVALWRREPRSGVWLGEAALGDAGATCFGYFGARWGPRGRALVAHGHTGAMHLWRDVADRGGSKSDLSLLMSEWRPVAAGGGHTAAVVDLAWVAVDPPPPPAPPSSQAAGDAGPIRRRRRRPRLLLQTASADQTARLFAEVAVYDESGKGRRRWCELARTQVHGHDFNALAPIPSPFAFSAPPPPGGAEAPGDAPPPPSPPPPALMYACCSEEKVLRVFEAPQAFLDTLELTWPEEEVEEEEEDDDERGATATTTSQQQQQPAPMTPEQQLRARGGRRGRPLGAAAQALGLSNKAIFAEDLQKDAEEEAEAEAEEAEARGAAAGRGGGGKKKSAPATNGPLASAEGPDQAPFAAPAAVPGPPLEEHLAQSTLWPEAAKLHGHANDAFSCAASPCGRLLASACRAQASAPRDADVWVWEVGPWRSVARLAGGHTLTATQLAFSPPFAAAEGGVDGGRWLASVSRDRSLAVWRVRGGGGGSAAGAASAAADWSFELVARVPSAHARVIWGVAWAAPVGGGGGSDGGADGGSARRCGPVLATGARDGLVRLWEVVDEESSSSPSPKKEVRRLGQLPAFAAAVTSVAAAPRALVAATAGGGGGDSTPADDCAVLAVGLEDGGVQVWLASCRPSDDGPHHRLLWSAGPGERHAGAVRRLAWAPARGGGRGGRRWRPFLLGSCGEDGAVRVYEVYC